MNDDVIALMESDDQKNMNIGQELERLSGDNYVSFIKLSKSGQYLIYGTSRLERNWQPLKDVLFQSLPNLFKLNLNSQSMKSNYYADGMMKFQFIALKLYNR